MVADGDSAGSGGPDRIPCDWFQTHENVVDPFHVFVLHSTFTTAQFADPFAQRPDVSWEVTENGICAIQVRVLSNGSSLRRVVELVLPNVRFARIGGAKLRNTS